MTEMILAASTWDDVGKAATSFAFVAILGGATGLAWGVIGHRRELDLAALREFRDAYGRWCTVWRAWSAAIEALGDDERVPPIPVDARIRLDLMRRAADVEGIFDALLLKIAIERRLNENQIRRLGRFREGYQQLRESIEESREVPFRVQYDPNNVTAYLAFKALSVEFAALLSERAQVAHPSTWGRPSLGAGQRTFVQITSWRPTPHPNLGEHDWWSASTNETLRTDLLAQLSKLQL